MKLTVISDLHLEFANSTPLWQNPGTDLLILGGDICNANHLYRNPVNLNPKIIQKDSSIHRARRYREFFEHVNKQWTNIIYIMGNHEFYDCDWNKTESIIRDEMSRFSNIHFFEQNKLVVNDIVFLGATLWTDMNHEDPLTMIGIRNELNDFKCISNFGLYGWQRLLPQTTVDKHKETIKWLRFMLSEDKRKTVIVSHHAPSRQSIYKSYKTQWLTNGAFVTDLDDFIIDHPHITLWCHGHTHNNFDYYINDTRVVCNPHGYPSENNFFNPNLIIEI